MSQTGLFGVIAGLEDGKLSAVSLVDILIPPREAWDQGDICDQIYCAALDALRPAVLVTPACDLEHDKVDLWTFVTLFPDTEVARQLAKPEIAGWASPYSVPLSKKQLGTLGKIMHSLLLQKFPRYHWIPAEIGDYPAQVADFTCVTSLPAREVRAKAKRLASLKSSWREQLPTRYAAYLGRVGTEDFLEDGLLVHVERLVESIVKQ